MAWPCGRYHFFGGAIMRFILTKLLQIRIKQQSVIGQLTPKDGRREKTANLV